MKIGFVTASNITNNDGYTIRVLSELTQLKKQNINTAVLSFLHLRFWGNISGIRSFVEKVRSLGYPIWLIPVFPDNQLPLGYKLVDKYYLSITKRFVHNEKIEILHCQATLAGYIGQMVAEETKIMSISDMHGLLSEEQAHRFKKNNVALERLNALEKKAVQNKAIIFVSSAMQDFVKNQLGSTSQIQSIIPCAVNTNLFVFQKKARESLRAEWGVKSEDPVFVYLGSYSFYQKIDLALLIFKQMNLYFKNAKMLILTPPSDVQPIKNLLQEIDIDASSVLIYSVQHSDVPKFLSACDIGFLLRDNILLNNVSSPTKFGEYIATGVPVITSEGILDIKKAVQDYKLGFLYKGDYQNLAHFVHSVMETRNEWITKCENYAQNNYSWDLFGNNLSALYSKFAQEK